MSKFASEIEPDGFGGVESTNPNACRSCSKIDPLTLEPGEASIEARKSVSRIVAKFDRAKDGESFEKNGG